MSEPPGAQDHVAASLRRCPRPPRAHTTPTHAPGSRRRPSARVPAPRSAFVAPRRLDAAGGGAAPAANGAGHSPTNAATRSKLPQPLATSPAAIVASCRDCSPKSAARTASRSRRAATRLCALSSVHFVAKSPISGYSCSLITSSLCIAQPPQWVALILSRRSARNSESNQFFRSVVQAL